MAKGAAIWVWCILYAIAGTVISWFLPDAYRYPFGFIIALIARWSFYVLIQDVVRKDNSGKEAHHG